MSTETLSNEPSSSNTSYQMDLLPFEESLMSDTFLDDLLIITARGLALERIFLNHLYLYSDSALSVIVLNTKPEDEHFYIEKLKQLNVRYSPKIMTADVSIKDRTLIYKTGGVQFVTSRIFMVDLLMTRVPLDDIAGILVYRAHEALTSYQEPFILRLFREKKQNGFVKAFTDYPSGITRMGLGQLQRLIDRLYVKRVEILPRFDEAVKATFEASQPKLVEISVDLSVMQRRVRTCLIDIISTCIRDLKQCTNGIEVESEEDAIVASAALRPSTLELELRNKSLLLTERQERLLNDLRILRNILEKAENLDPVSVHVFISDLRSNKSFMDNNSGWIFSSTAEKVFETVKNQCMIKDVRGQQTIAAPPKWSSLETVLNEIKEDIQKDQQIDQPPILVLASTESTCAQLIDLVKFGQQKFNWLRTQRFSELESKPFNVPEPENKPIWSPDLVALYDEQVLEMDKKQLINEVKKEQKKAGRARKRKAADVDPKQMKLASFGIVRYAEKKSSRVKTCSLNSNTSDEATTNTISVEVEEEVFCLDDESRVSTISAHTLPLLLFTTLSNRYNLINCLESLKPKYVILYHSEISSTRIIECYAAQKSSNRLKLYVLSYTNSSEEERYLISIQNEQMALEVLLRDQKILLFPTEFDTTREDASQFQSLSLQADSRRDHRAEINEEFQPTVIVDMREFNSELPTVIYKRGIDLQPATLEVGDYVLSPTICVERKALDDLAQSLTSGRIFKQIEQMIRHYSRSVLLIESSEKFRRHRANGGPFQGELSRRSRETRSLFTMLIRSNPKLSVLWSLSPSHSCELFEELKFEEPNPDIDNATAIRSDDLGSNSNESQKESKNLNSVVRRQFQSLPILTTNDIERAMRSDEFETVADFIQADADVLRTSASISQQQADELFEFFRYDFRITN